MGLAYPDDFSTERQMIMDTKNDKTTLERDEQPADSALSASPGSAVVCMESLPAGPGVLPSEVGKLGPWYGVRWPDGTIYGWWHRDYGIGGEKLAHDYARRFYRRLSQNNRSTNAEGNGK